MTSHTALSGLIMAAALTGTALSTHALSGALTAPHAAHEQALHPVGDHHTPTPTLPVPVSAPPAPTTAQPTPTPPTTTVMPSATLSQPAQMPEEQTPSFSSPPASTPGLSTHPSVPSSPPDDDTLPITGPSIALIVLAGVSLLGTGALIIWHLKRLP